MIPVRYKIGDAELFCIQTDRFKSEFFSFRYTIPVSAEYSQQIALLNPLLKQGTVHYPGKVELNCRLDELYSTTVSGYSRRVGDVFRMGLSADILGAKYVGGRYGVLPEVMDVMSDIWMHPLRENGYLRSDFLEREKIVLRDAIRSEINNPRGYALSRCKKLLCPGEPFSLSVIGTEDTVDSITPQAVTERYEHILHNHVPNFWYVGALHPEDVAELIATRLPLIKGRTDRYGVIVKRGDGTVATGEAEMPLCQGRLSLGFRTDVTHGHPLAAATLMLGEIYGGSPASKLFLNVREKRSLCYHCGSSLNLYKGVIFAGAGMKPQNRAVTEEAMLAEFAALAAGQITDTEMEAARRSLDYSCRQLFDMSSAMSDFYDGRMLIGSDQTIDACRAAIQSVTREQVVEAASHFSHGATFFLKGTLEGEEGDE